MKARMEKYDTESSVKQRTKRNEGLYSEVGNMNIDYAVIDVDNAVELSPVTSKKSSREDFQKQRELNKILPSNREKISNNPTYVEEKEERVYDINEILKMARENKLFEDEEKKRLINTEYNILTKLDVDSLKSDEMKKEDLRSLIDDIYEKEKPLEKEIEKNKEKYKKYSRSEEAKLLADLFEDNEDTKEEEKSIEIGEELSQKILDKEEEKPKEEPINNEKEDEEIATQIVPDSENKKLENSMYDFGIDKKFKKKKEKQKNMLEGVDLKKAKEESIIEEDEETEGKGLVVAIVIVVILIILTCAFFVYEYFFGI